MTRSSPRWRRRWGPTGGRPTRRSCRSIPRTGIVMQVPIEGVDAAAGTVVWRDEEGERFETEVTGGRAKCQWKADWAMRWFALGVDYEMSGKDLIESVKLSGKICRILGGAPPLGFTYELFLDAAGQKISKSKGNGLTVDDWLRYAPAESLSQFMYNQPQRAKRLHFDVIPRAVDDIVANATALAGQSPAEAAANPAWHVLGAHRRDVPVESPIPFGMLLNLVSVANAETAGGAVGLSAALRAGGGSGARTVPRPPARPCDRLLCRRRAAGQGLPGAERARAGGAGRSARHAGRAAGGAGRGEPADRGLCGRQAAPVRGCCATGSPASTRFCSARRRGRASAASSRSMAATRPWG